MKAALRGRQLWARIGLAIAIVVVGAFLKDLSSPPSLPPDSVNLRRVDWSGTLAADGALAVEVRYEFLPEALKNDPDRPRASLKTPDHAIRMHVNGRPVPVDGFNGVAPATTDDLVTTVSYEVPDAARRVDDRVLLDVAAISPLHWLYNNYSPADAHITLHVDRGAASKPTLRFPGAQEVRVEVDSDRIVMSGRVSTYDEAGIVALLATEAAPDAPEYPAADGRTARELFTRAADERSPGRVPDGLPESKSG